MAEGAPLSVVITAYTMERLQGIYELLDSIKAQSYGNIEVIFVAERSEELYEKVKRYVLDEHILNTTLLFNDGEPGASAARNLGIAEAHGEIIAFVDDDAVPYPDWAEKMVHAYGDESVIGVTGPALPLWQGKPERWLPEELYWVVGCTSWADWKEPTDVRNAWTMNASFRHDALKEAGLFSTHIGPRGGSMAGRKTEMSEDVELSLRIRRVTGKRIVFHPDVRVKHRVDKSRLKLGFISRWSYWLGYSKCRLGRQHPESGRDALSQEHGLLKRIVFRLFPRMIPDMLRHPLSTCHRFFVTVAVLACVGVGYVTAAFDTRTETAPA